MSHSKTMTLEPHNLDHRALCVSSRLTSPLMCLLFTSALFGACDEPSSSRDSSREPDQSSNMTYDQGQPDLDPEPLADQTLTDSDITRDLGVDQSVDMSSDSELDIDVQMDSETPLEPPPWDPPLGDRPGHFKVRVLLDQSPVSGAIVTQGGARGRWITDDQGEVWVTLDVDAIPPLMVFGAHPEARTRGEEVSVDQTEGVSVSLTRYIKPDQPAYPFADPGEPSRRGTTSQCGHCHLNINDEWFNSPHRTAARNPIVYDLYTGRGSGWSDEESCVSAGGRWALGPYEGGGEAREQCYFEISALGAFNSACSEPPCDPENLDEDAYFGGCADCHAPTVNDLSGGGHDLLSVEGRAFEYGVSCDLCHHVESVRLDQPAGVGGRLALQRPRESGPVTLGGGGYLPLSFGPNADVANPRMGISPRAHFRDGSLCGGCHQHSHDDIHALNPIDLTRWPEGRLPNQSTYAEWREGPLGRAEDPAARVACNACHMPPNPGLMNSANLERFPNADIGVQGGWPRPLGETRAHAWWGPRQPQSPILQQSAGLTVSEPSRIEDLTDPDLELIEVSVDVSNLGAGHGLPTGEPMRHLILVVEASCDGSPLEARGGDAVHELGGSLETRAYDERSSPWPRAQVGDTLRVVRTLAERYDYDGYGPFRDTSLDTERGISGALSFSPEGKGLTREVVVSSSRVTAVSDTGSLTLSQPLLGSSGDRVYLTRGEDMSGISGASYAGQSGFTFARVLIDDAGREMTPHFIATDLIRDNRLRPGAHWRTRHRFKLETCQAAPLVEARLIYRPYPLWLARERGWEMWDRVIRRVSARLDVDSVDQSELDPRGASRDIGALWSASAQEFASELEEGERASLALSVDLQTELEASLLDNATLPMLLVSLDPLKADAAMRRGEATPWSVRSVPSPREGEEAGGDVHSLALPARLMNLSGAPLAIEPIEGVSVFGASLEQSEPLRDVPRSTPSEARSLLIVPPHSGVTLIPNAPLDAAPLIAAGYSAHGGRSWSPSTSLATLEASPERLSQLSQRLTDAAPRSPIITRAPLSYGSDRSGAMWRWSYQGSPRADMWHLAQSSVDQDALPALSAETSDQPLAKLIAVRNLSATGQPFEIEGAHHWQWIEGQGWSDPLSVSWVPIQGELLVAVPQLSAGARRIGALDHLGLWSEVSFE